MKYLLILFAITLSLTLNAQDNTVKSTEIIKNPSENTHYTFTIIPSVNKTWGYDIYMKKRLFIHQPSIPGLPGNEGFKTKASAEKVARLVIEKIQKCEMPPCVTIQEMEKLKVL
jgi:hypothetical protein